MSLEEKRKLYVCGKSYVCLADIPLWPVLYKKVKAPLPPSVRARTPISPAQKLSTPSADSNKVGATKSARLVYKPTPPPPTPEPEIAVIKEEIKPTCEITMKTDLIKDDINHKISLWQGDITKLEIDAIVNGSNTTLRDKGGEHHSIHKIAGPTLMKECLALNGCATGEAKITSGHKLPAKYIIHTVGPIGKHQSNLLQKCYENCLRIVLEYNIKSVAFCCISTGMYGYPNREAAEIALKTVRRWLVEHSAKVERIILCTFLSRDFQIYQRLMSSKYFPCECNYKEKPIKTTVTDENKENFSLESINKSDVGTANKIPFKHEISKHTKARGTPSSHRSTVASGNKKISPRNNDAAAADSKVRKKIYLREKFAGCTYKKKCFKSKPAVPRGFKQATRADPEVEVNGTSDNCTSVHIAPQGDINDISEDYSGETGNYSAPEDGLYNTCVDEHVNITDKVNNDLNAPTDAEVNNIPATYITQRLDSNNEVNHVNLKEEINDTFDEGIVEHAHPQPEIYYTYNSGTSRYTDIKPSSYLRDNSGTSRYTDIKPSSYLRDNSGTSRYTDIKPSSYLRDNSGTSRYTDIKPSSYLRDNIDTVAEINVNSKYDGDKRSSDYPSSSYLRDNSDTVAEINGNSKYYGDKRSSDYPSSSYLRDNSDTIPEINVNSKYYGDKRSSDYPSSECVATESERNDMSYNRLYKRVDYTDGLSHISDSYKTHHFNGRIQHMIHRFNDSSINKI